MTEFNVIQSATWPFEEYHGDIPQGLFADAHVVSADTCSLNAVTVVSGSIFVSLTAMFNGMATAVSSGSVALARNAKIKFYDGVGKCYGWLLTGDVLPEKLVVQDVDYPLAGDVCVPFDSYVPGNTGGMTGDWTIVGMDGITVSTRFDESTGTLHVDFGTDEEWYTVEDPNFVQKTEGEGIWTLNGLAGDIKFRLENGKIFPDLSEVEDIFGMEMVPDLVFFSDAADGSGNSHKIFTVGANDHSWSSGNDTVTEQDGVFTVTIGGKVRTMGVNETVVTKVLGKPRLERLAIRWAGCPDADPFRKYVKTSKETGSQTPFPLDGILNGTVNGQ